MHFAHRFAFTARMVLAVALFAFAGTAHSWEAREGQLPDGTLWRAMKPDRWNGTLLLDLDFAGYPSRTGGASEIDRAPNPFRTWALAQGYALGGIQREPVGYQFRTAVEHLLFVHDAVASTWGRPTRTIALGGSRGAFVARLAVELKPEIFGGAVVWAGGGAGSIAVLNSKLDGSFALKTLVDPESPLRLVDIRDIAADTAAMDALVKKALETPAGRARLALAAAFEQYDRWTVRDRPQPGPRDYDAQLDQIGASFAFANPALVRAGVEKVGGGNVSWNHGIDYARLLKRSGNADMVEALYQKAGLDLKRDLRTLARAPRITADPAAVARAEKIVSYTGRIAGPVINVDDFDPVDPAPQKLAYVDTLRRAGRDADFRLLWIARAGHGTQSALERATALTLLVRRLDAGKWDDTSPSSANALATEIARAAPALGDAKFHDYAPPPPLRTWDSSNWDSYAAPKAR